MMNLRCDICGRFVRYSQIPGGKVVHRLVCPDSAYTAETTARRAAAIEIVQGQTAARWRNGECGDSTLADVIDQALQQAQASGLREAWDKLREFQRLYGHLEMDYSHFKHWLWQQIEARAKG